ncbi:DUF4227 family protein [Sporolactobacillus sp. THM7-4]|nr:DUF4227 family protein [Sporolactobacillus sp. THM7-4]
MNRKEEYLRAVLSAWRVLILFILLTVIFYFGLVWVDRNQGNFHRYDQPDGEAVKVYRPDPSSDPVRNGSDMPNVLPRILEFLRNGE